MRIGITAILGHAFDATNVKEPLSGDSGSHTMMSPARRLFLDIVESNRAAKENVERERQ